MRFIIILLLALTLTVMWQSSAFAGMPASHKMCATADQADKDQKDGGRQAEQEPECE